MARLAIRTLLVWALLASAVSVLMGTGVAASASNHETDATAVGEVTETYVDTHRTTAAWGPEPERSSRTLLTTILYPALGASGSKPVPGARPDRAAGPFPLIVFGHGLGGTPQEYMKLLGAWAAAGYVVAAPLFPLSSGVTPGGPDGADVVNQPADMSFVVREVLGESAKGSGPLAGLVDPREIGAAGHSNGAITTLGLVGNSCCRDPLVKAAVVMAGTEEGFPGGRFELAKAPPLVFVHDTADPVVPYRSAVVAYNQARGPKGLLTIEGSRSGDVTAHMAASGVTGPSSEAVLRTTTAFFNTYLKGEGAAAIMTDGRSPYTTIHFDAKKGGTATLGVPATPVVHLKATVEPDSGLSSGQTVTIEWSGYTAGKVVNVLECSHVDITSADSAGCDFANAKILQPDPAGKGSLQMQVMTGTVGNGVCDASHRCAIVVNDASSTNPHDSVVLPIRFAP